MTLYLQALDKAMAFPGVRHFLQMGAPAAEQQKGDLLGYAANTA